MEIQIKDFTKIIEYINVLTRNSDVPSYQLRRTLSKVQPILELENKNIIDQQEIIAKKYFDKVENGQMKLADLKEGMNIEDYYKELDDFMETTIDIEPFEIKETDLENVFIFNIKGDKIALPADYMITLDRFIKQ